MGFTYRSKEYGEKYATECEFCGTTKEVETMPWDGVFGLEYDRAPRYVYCMDCYDIFISEGRTETEIALCVAYSHKEITQNQLIKARGKLAELQQEQVKKDYESEKKRRLVIVKRLLK